MDAKTNENTFRFPECWEDDIRMVALFAPFRSKNLNPNDWSSKMAFWTSLIENWCKYNNFSTINISIIKKEFSRKGIEPACLEDVLENLFRTGIIISKEEFLDLCENWKEWAIKKFFTQPLKYTFDVMKSALLGKNEKKETDYIHLPAIKHLSETLLNKVPPHFQEKLVEFDDIMTLWKMNDPENTFIVLVWLQKKEMAAIYKENGCTLVKFSKNFKKSDKINKIDLGIFNLEKQQKALENSVERLEKEKITVLEEMKKHFLNNKKDLATISLKKKKEIDKNIESKRCVLQNIVGLLQRIDQAKLDGNVLECYQKGVNVLNETLKQYGLNKENVNITMENLENAFKLSSETSESLSKSLDVLEMQNLEDELNCLLINDLPDVPNTIIGSNDIDKNIKKKSKLEKIKLG